MEASVSDEPLAKIQAATAAEICLRYDVPMDARALLRDAMTPREFLEVLAGAKRYVQGIDFLAHALPPREGIWWGSLCLQHARGEALYPAERAAWVAALRWVIQPTGENQAAAQAPAGAAGVMSPAGALAWAAVGGIEPGPYGPAATVARAVKLASSQCSAVGIIEAQRSYLELGIGVAEGKYA